MPQDWSQDQINDFVRDIAPYFEVAEGGPSAQQSWPIPDEPLGVDQFRAMYQHLRGIFGRGGRPYWLRGHATDAETNSRNSLFLTVSTTTGTAEGTIHGSYHRMTEDLEVSLPAVVSATTYYIVIEYDPVRAGEGGLACEARVVTSLDRSQGKDYILLWELPRSPNQLLSEVQWIRHRPFAASVITTNNRNEFPEPASILSGTVAIGRHDNTMMTSMMPNEPDDDGNVTSSGRWIDLMNSSWVERYDRSYEWAGHGHRPASKKHGDMVSLRGRLGIANGNSFNTGQNGNSGYRVMVLPEAQRPAVVMTFVTQIGPRLQMGYSNVWILPDGDVLVHVSRDVRWVALDGISFDVSP